MKIKLLVLFSALCLFFSILSAQTTVTWALSTDKNPSQVSGTGFTANAQSCTLTTPSTIDYTAKKIDGTTGAQRAKGTYTSCILPTAYDPNSYLEYNLTATSGYNLTVSAISMNLGGSGTANIRCAIAYSTDNFSNSFWLGGYTDLLPLTPIRNDAATSAPYLSALSFSSFNSSSYITVTGGSSLKVRVYPWITTATTSSKYIVSSNVQITFNATSQNLPLFSTQPIDNQSVCQGSSVSLGTVVAQPVTGYQWYSNTTKSNIGGSLIVGATGTSYTPSASVSGTFYYYCVASNSDGSTASDPVQFTVQSLLSANAGNDISINFPAVSSALAANAPGLGSGSWSIVSGPSTSLSQFSSLSSPTATFTPIGGAGKYILRWTTMDGCNSSISFDDMSFTLSLVLPTIPARTYDITSYGASASSTNNTTAIQNTINACNTAGGGTVVIPAGTFLCGPITMKSNINLQISAGAILKLLPYGTGNGIVTDSYPNNGTLDSYSNFIFGTGLNNIKISGTGIIEGQGSDWWTAYDACLCIGRPCLMRFESCNYIQIDGITLQNAPNVHITIGRTCTNSTISNVNINSPSTSPNTDGIDTWSPFVNIFNCNITCGDDNIAMDSGSRYITVKNCTFGTGHGCSIGSFTSTIGNILVDSCTFNGTGNGARLKSSRDRGGIDEYITYSNCTMNNVGNAFYLTSYYPKEPAIPDTASTMPITATTPNWRHITFKNISVNSATSAGLIWGLPEQYISDVVFDSVRINATGYMKAYNVSGLVFKNGSTISVANRNTSGNVIDTYSADITGMNMITGNVPPVTATTYYWVGGATPATNFNDGTNWSTMGTGGAAGSSGNIAFANTDVLIFDGADISSVAGAQTGAVTIATVNVTPNNVGGIILKNSANVTITAGTTCNFNIYNIVTPLSGNNFSIESGSTFSVYNVILNLYKTSTGIVNGALVLGNGTYDGKVLCADSLALNVFGTITYQMGGNANVPFGSATTNSIIFKSGSMLIGKRGGDIFSGSKNVIKFEHGSTFDFQFQNMTTNFPFAVGTAPQIYANVVFNSPKGIGALTTNITVDNLTLASGQTGGQTIDLKTNSLTIKGNIVNNTPAGALKTLTVSNNSVAGTGTINFAGTSPQYIYSTNGGGITFGGITAGDLTAININNDVALGNEAGTNTGNIGIAALGILSVSSGSSLDAGTSVVSGAGAFVLSDGGTLKTKIASGIPGNITTASKTFNTGASYVFNTATTTPFGSLSINTPKDLTVNAAITLDQNLTLSGTLNLSSGQLNNSTRSLTLGNGATVLKSGGSLSISPSFGTLVNLTYTGSSTKGNEFPATDIIGALTVNNIAGISLTDNRSLSNLSVGSSSAVSIAAGKQLTVNSSFTNNGILNLLSDATGTATILTPVTMSGTGKANVQQYLTSGRNWYVSSPVSGALSSSLSTGSSVVYYNEPTASWVTVSGTYLLPMKGYISVSTGSTGTVTFNGTLNNGSQTIGLKRTDGVAKEGFNLVGNPYPSYVNWGMATKSNLEPSMWYRSKNAGNTAYVFDTYNSSSNIGTSNNGVTVTSYIPPMQAFWVHVVPGDSIGSLSFNNSMRSHANASTNKLRAPALNIQSVLRLQITNGTNSDEAILLFDPNASDNRDEYDSPKMSNGNDLIPEIFTVIGNEELVINGLNSNTTTAELPLGFRTGEQNNFTIKATEINNFDQTRVILKDNLLNTELDITAGEAYNFSSTPTNSLDRFSVLFKTNSLTTEMQENTTSSVRVYKNENKQIIVSCSDKLVGKGTITLVNSMGQSIVKVPVSQPKITLKNQLTSGVYIVVIKSDIETISRKILID